MRLLNTLTLKMYEFYDAEIPDYAILSHTWTKYEVSLQMLEDPKSVTLAGYTKIKRCCELALSEGWKYAWIDTCCIDKTSSADLSEAINAMYRWYEKAQVCYVYMADVSAATFDKAFRISRWFFRGWTLQELLAPKTVVFYGRDWEELGTKWSLKDEISRATGITHHQMIDHKSVNVATKMSWAAMRETTRIEDTAYCLLGLFDINLPLLYGEGSKAFMRLQHEILQTRENDESIFAWKDSKTYYCGLLARSPAPFALSGNIISVKNPNRKIKPPSVTKRLLTMDGSDSRSEYQLQKSGRYIKNPSPYIILNCVQQGIENGIVGIEVTERVVEDSFAMSSSGVMERRSSFLDYFMRSSPGKLLQCKFFRGSLIPDDPNILHTMMKISLDHIPFVPSNQQQKLTAILPSLVDSGFLPSERHPNDSAFTSLPSVFPLRTRPEGWKVVLDLSWSSTAAVMFRSEKGEVFAVVLTAKESGVGVDVFLPEGTEMLGDIIDNYSLYLQRRPISDRSFSELQEKHDVCATSRKRFVNYEMVYFVDIKISPKKAKSHDSKNLGLFRRPFLATPSPD
ncbi:MAG: hypothetical protein ASARMPREDX12_008763 [Alectoria sarmentosa]|nr:MAG: hypothetical protein ASARMPREDX12_008763 [Alectoria sarmentosa]